MSKVNRENAFERRLREVKDYSNKAPDQERFYPVESEKAQRHLKPSRREYKVVLATATNLQSLYDHFADYRELQDVSHELTRLASQGWIVRHMTSTPIITENREKRGLVGAVSTTEAVLVTLVLSRTI